MKKMTKRDVVEVRCVGCSKFGVVDRAIYRPAGWFMGLGFYKDKGYNNVLQKGGGRFLLGPWCPSCRARVEEVQLDEGADLTPEPTPAVE